MEAKLLKLMCQLRLEGIVFELNSFEYGSQKANEIVMQGIRPLELTTINDLFWKCWVSILIKPVGLILMLEH